MLCWYDSSADCEKPSSLFVSSLLPSSIVALINDSHRKAKPSGMRTRVCEHVYPYKPKRARVSILREDNGFVNEAKGGRVERVLHSLQVFTFGDTRAASWL